MYSYICGLTFNYICRFYRLLKYLVCFQCIRFPRQLVKHRTKKNNHHAEIMYFFILQNSSSFSESALPLLQYRTPVFSQSPIGAQQPFMHPHPPGWGGAQGWACVCSRKWKRQGEKEEQHFVFLWELLGEESIPPTQLYLCCSYNTGSEELCKWEAETGCSNGNNPFPFSWHRKSRHQPTPRSLQLALPTGLSWLQTEIQFSWKTSSLVIHPVSGLQNRKFVCVNKSAFPLILAKG